MVPVSPVDVTVWPALFVSLPASAVAMVVVSMLTPAPDPKCYDLYFDEEWEKNHPEAAK